MDIYKEYDRQKTLELISLYGSIDVIIDISDLSSLDSTAANLGQIFIDYAFGEKDGHIKRFLIVGFRGEKVHVGRINTWKTSKEECEIYRELTTEEKNVPCVDKEWCKKFGNGLYEMALKEFIKSLDYTVLSMIFK